MPKLSIDRLSVIVFMASVVWWQNQVDARFVDLDQNQTTSQTLSTVMVAYTKWRDEALRNFVLGALTPHYAVAIVAQRLDDSTAQVEVLIAAEMKQYTVSIKPVTLNRLASGETESRAAGNAVTINQKAGDKLGTGLDKIRIGQTTTTVVVGKAVQALEITWTPKNDKPDDPSNTCIVRLGKEPEVLVNGYVIGSPVR